MAKDKKFKIEQNEKQRINTFTNAVDSQMATGNYARFHNFEEIHNKDGYCKSAVLDYDKYKVRIYYNPSYLFSNYLDFKIILGGKYEYSIYDIFNLFDIKDFGQYYYSDLEIDNDVINAVKAIMDIINKYDFDICKAADKTAELDENVEKDYKTTFPKDENESWRDCANDILSLDVTHPYFTSASNATDSDKLLKKLKKANSKNKLTTIYEKRLLEYLEQGYKVVNESYVASSKQKNEHSRITAKIIAMLAAVITVSYAVILLACRYIIFSGAYVPTSKTLIGALTIPIGLEAIINFVLAVAITTISLYFLFGKLILKKLGNDDAASRFDLIMFGDTKHRRLRLISVILSGIFFCAVGFGYMATNFINIGFYDDYVKFNNYTVFDSTEIKYEDLTLIKVLGEYKDDEYTEYSDRLDYLFCESPSTYYELENINPEGESAKRIESIIDEYQLTVKEVKSVSEYTDTEDTE